MERKTAIVIGTGAGGAMMAKELQKKYQVTILERGGEFHPFRYPFSLFSKLRKTGFFFDERLISLIMPNMRIDKTKDMVLVHGRGVGGTTTLATGNAVRYDMDLAAIGIDLEEEFQELYKELPITTDHRQSWNPTTQKIYHVFEEMGLNPVVTPKLLDAQKCCHCGHCAIGCPVNAKWDTRELVDEAVRAGATLIKGCRVKSLEISHNKVTKVKTRVNGRAKNFTADLIVLAAGGMNTPVILKNSGIQTENKFFVDPVLCVAAPIKNFGQDKELLMPFISQQDGYILSPYMDYLSYFFNKKWYLPMKEIASIMIKLKDDTVGDVTAKKIDKPVTKNDKERLNKAVALSTEILLKLGAKKEEIYLGTLNAGHPGGMLPLTEKEKDTLHNDRLPDNLYVADATLFNDAMGNPPMLTIMALAKKIAKKL